MKPDEPLSAKDKNQKKACEELKQKNAANIQDGIDCTEQSPAVAPRLRRRHGVHESDVSREGRRRMRRSRSRAADLKTADEWVDKTMAAKKAKAEKQPGRAGHYHGSAEVRSATNILLREELLPALWHYRNC